jgi:hypothetical protein
MKRSVLFAILLAFAGLALAPSSWATPPRQHYDCPDPDFSSGDDDSPNKNLLPAPDPAREDSEQSTGGLTISALQLAKDKILLWTGQTRRFKNVALQRLQLHDRD